MPGNPYNRGPTAGQHVGSYEIVSHLARGDMGEVYLAHHPRSGRQVAIKVIDAALCADPRLLQLYEHEVWAVNHLGHPAIVEVLDFGKLDGGRAYLVMSLLRGRSLAAHLAERGRLSPEDVRAFLTPILEALVAVHGAGITHKDLKPSNIFLKDRPDGGVDPKLLDCGLAHLKPLSAVPGSMGQKSSSSLPLYSAPEQVTGELQAVGPWSDIYAVGALMYHLLAGQPPYPGARAEDVVGQHLRAPPPDLTKAREDAHPNLARVIQQAMAKRPVDRFESMQAFLRAFLSASAMRAPTLRGPTAVPPEHLLDRTPPPAAPTAPAPMPQPRHAQAPPPTLRIDAGQVSLPSAVPPGPAPPQAYAPQAPAPQAYAPQSYAPQSPAPQGYVPQAAPPQGYVPPAYAPPGYAPPGYAPQPRPAAAGPGSGYAAAPPRRAGRWLLLMVVGFVVIVAAVAGLVVALQDDSPGKSVGGKTEKIDEGHLKRAEKKPSPAMAQAIVVPKSVPPPVAVLAPKGSGPSLLRALGDQYKVDITGRPWRGARHAKVTIAMFCSFSSYSCRQRRGIYDQLVKAYPSDVKLVWMDFPKSYYQRDLPASIAAAEVFAQLGNPVFWKYHEKVFANPYQLTDANLEKWATEVGADGAKVRSALATAKGKSVIDALVQRGADLGVYSSPTLFVNGRKVYDPRTYDDLKRHVDSAVAEADRVIGTGGVTLQGYYDHIQKNAKLKRSYGGGLFGTRTYQPLTTYRSSTAVYRIEVSDKNPQRGPKDALVTLVLWGDFQCPFTFQVSCALRALLKKHSFLRVVWMNNPLSFHGRAQHAAEAALAGFAQLGNKGFWAMHDLLFPTDLCLPDGGYRYGFFRRRDKLYDEDLATAARKAGLQVSRFQRDMRRRAFQTRVDEEQKLAKSFTIYSTPTFYINGKYFSGVKKVTELTVLLDKARADALKLKLKNNLKASQVYDHIIRNGVRGKPYP
ncbi:MAG: thioredoxin domain-containing protein [bacterium]